MRALRNRIRAAIVLASTATIVVASMFSAGLAQGATGQICTQFGTTTQGNYIVMNNRWGTSATQCINVTTSGFQIVQQDGTGNLSGAPTAYPAIYLGCHYTVCSPNSPLPMQISRISSATSSTTETYPSSGTYDAAYDIWLNDTADVSGVQKTEIMIWMNHTGSIQPIGSQTGTATIAGHTWNVWTGNNGANNVVSYQAAGITSLSFNVMSFITDTLSRGSQYGSTAWYLSSIQDGFEPWVGGVGLAVSNFSASVIGNGGTPPPPTPAATATAAPTATPRPSATATPRASATATPRPSATATPRPSATATPRPSATATPRASSTPVVTPAPTGTASSGAKCTAAIVESTWSNGFTAAVTVTNSGTVATKSWKVSWTWGGNQAITNSWNAAITSSGTAVTAANQTYNAAIAAAGNTTFGFQASYSGTNAAPTLTCSAT